MKTSFQETLISKFKMLEAMNAFLGFYIITIYIVYWYLGSLPKVFIYLTLALGISLILLHIHLSLFLRKSFLDNDSLLTLRFVSSAVFTFGLFVLAIVCSIVGCIFESTLAFAFALLFVLDHALYVSIDLNQIRQSRQKPSAPLRAAA